MCEELQEVLKEQKHVLFDCVGGCGIDTSGGKNPCMSSAGIWFKFCPFCGNKIESSYKNGAWEWHEEAPPAKKRKCRSITMSCRYAICNLAKNVRCPWRN